MGMFGYMCVGCEESIRGNEKAVLKHIRHGEVLGETRGTYDFYGGVLEEVDLPDAYRGDHGGINGNDAACDSEFIFPDSEGYDAKLYKGIPMEWMQYRQVKVSEGMEDLCVEMYEEYNSLPWASKSSEPRSGTEAWHAFCYDAASEEIKKSHRISKSDPRQAWGDPRPEFM